MNIKYLFVLMIILAIAFHYNAHVLMFYAQQPEVEILISYGDERNIKNIADTGCYIERDFRSFGIALARCSKTAIDKLKQSPFLVTPNFDVSISITLEGFKVVSDPASLGQGTPQAPTYWSWAISRVSADIVWEYLGEKGFDTIIAILDTGIDPSHPLIAGKIAGWAEFDSKGRPICSRPRDTHGHGTWVASIAAGGDGVNYMFGVAPNAKLLVALVLPYGSGTAAQVLAGLEWALDPYDTCTNMKFNLRPAVVSMSFGAMGNYSNIFLPAIRKLIENGVVPVAAIGNGGPYSSANPGNIWGVIGVGAVNLDNDIASFSSYEEVEWPDPPSNWPFKGRYPKYYRKPDVVAPGVDVPGAFPGGLLVVGSGTSAATPIVASIAAIISTKLKAQGLTGSRLVEAVYDIVTSTTIPIDHPGAGSGLVEAYQAIAKAKNIAIRTISLSVYPQSVRPLDRIALRVDGVELGTPLSVFVSGVRVYKDRLTSTYITLDIPLTHLGGNTVVVISERGDIYGKTLVYVVPRLITDDTCFWGRRCRVVVSGIGIGDTIITYLDNTIMTLYFADLRGTCDSSFITPFTEVGFYNLTIIDVSTPQIMLRTRIYINSSPTLLGTVIINNTIVRNQTTVISNIYPIPIYVYTKEYYLANTIDFVDIYVYRGFIEGVVPSVVSTTAVDVQILNVTSISNNLYRVWFKIGSIASQEAYVVLNFSIVLNGVRAPHVVVIKILGRDPYKYVLSQVEQLRENMYTNASLLNRIVAEVANLQSLANKSIDTLARDIYVLRERLENLENNVDNILKQVEKLRNITLIAIALGATSIVLCISLILKRYIRYIS